MAEHPPDVVYTVRPGEENEELRYSLRALHACVPHGRVWIAGYMPTWVRGVRCLPTAQSGTRWENTANNIERAARHPEVASTFLAFNDDFFALRPTTGLDVTHRGTLASLVERIGRSKYSAGLRWTDDLLAKLGIVDGLAYTRHTPLPIRKELFVAAMERARSVPVPRSRTLSWRSLYGNIVQLGGVEAPDVKVASSTSRWDPEADWLSTNDGSFVTHEAGRLVRARYADPCPYEAPPGEAPDAYARTGRRRRP